MKHSFFGGVHPAGHKESTRRKPIAPLDKAPEQVVEKIKARHQFALEEIDRIKARLEGLPQA